MRKLLLLSLALVLLAGCKKTAGGGKTNPPSTSGSGGASVHAPTGVVMNPGLGGGGGGAYQAVRKAAGRIVPENDLHNLQIYITAALTETGKMPTVQDLSATLQREAPGIYKQVQTQALVLTGTQSKDGIWAYTKDAQTAAGEHLVLVANGVERMDEQTLKQRLK